MSLIESADRLPTYDERRHETPLHPLRCGPCAECAEFADAGNQPCPLRRKLLNGKWTDEPAPSYAGCVRHARRFGVHEVYGTAVREGLAPLALVQLKTAIREIAHGQRSRFGTKAKTAAPDADDIHTLYESGLTPEEIASQLGRSLTSVRKTLRKAA